MKKRIFDSLLERDAMKLKRLGGIVAPIRRFNPPLLFEVALKARLLETASHVVFGDPRCPTLSATAAQWQTASGDYFIIVKETDDFLRVFLDRRHDLKAFLEDLYVDAERLILEALLDPSRVAEPQDEVERLHLVNTLFVDEE